MSEETRFQPGNNGGPGRPKGSRNKLGEAFLEAMAEDFNDHGKEAIEKVRTDDPSTYIRVIASTLPKELKIDKPALAEMSDDELGRLIDIVRAAEGSAQPSRKRDAPKGSPPVTH